MNKIMILLLTFSFQGVAFAAAPDSNGPVKLEDYLTYAALNNAELKAGFENWKAALQQIPQARSLPDPMFTYEFDTEMGAKMEGFSVMQVFPWFGTLEARTDAAAAAAKAAYKRYESLKLKLFYDVKQAFYEYVYLAAAVEIARENLDLAKYFEEVATTRYQVSAASNPDVIRAQTEVAKLEYILVSLQQLRAPTVARLNSILNRHDSASLPWPDKPDYLAVTMNKDQLLVLLKLNNPELASFDFELQSAKNAIAVAEKRFFPEFGIGLKKERGVMSENGTRDAVMMMFSLNVPIWRGNYEAAKLQAKAQAERIRQERISAENNIAAQSAQALYDFEDSTRRISLYGDTLISKAQELVTNSESAYKAGTIDFLDLIDAQRMLLEYRLAYERALADNAQKLAELEMLTGSALADLHVGSNKQDANNLPDKK